MPKKYKIAGETLMNISMAALKAKLAIAAEQHGVNSDSAAEIRRAIKDREEQKRKEFEAKEKRQSRRYSEWLKRVPIPFARGDRFLAFYRGECEDEDALENEYELISATYEGVDFRESANPALIFKLADGRILREQVTADRSYYDFRNDDEDEDDIDGGSLDTEDLPFQKNIDDAFLVAIRNNYHSGKDRLGHRLLSCYLMAKAANSPSIGEDIKEFRDLADNLSAIIDKIKKRIGPLATHSGASNDN